MEPAPQHIITPGCSTVTYVIVVQLLHSVQLSETPWTAAHLASLPLTISPSFPQVLVHWVGDAIQPSHPPLPLFSFCLQSFPSSGSLPKSFCDLRDKIYFYSQYWPKNNMRNNSNFKVLWHFTFWIFCLFSFLSEQHPKLFLFLANHPLCESRWQARPYLTTRKCIFPLQLLGHRMTHT